jgi:hypothetical protein
MMIIFIIIDPVELQHFKVKLKRSFCLETIGPVGSEKKVPASLPFAALQEKHQRS